MSDETYDKRGQIVVDDCSHTEPGESGGSRPHVTVPPLAMLLWGMYACAISFAIGLIVSAWLK